MRYALFYTFFPLFIFCAMGIANGQESAVPLPVYCPAAEFSANTRVALSATQKSRLNPQSVISVEYENFPSEAIAAFERAVEVWESLLISKVPIYIKASWAEMAGNTLAYSSASRIYRNFDHCPYYDVWYAGPLAEALAGKDLNAGESDLEITFNQHISWSFLTDGSTEALHYDLMTVALHEIAHGLGFSASFQLINNDSEGQWGYTGYPYIYDLFVENQDQNFLTNKDFVQSPSSELREVMENDRLYFEIDKGTFSQELPQLNVTKPFRKGESISHINESVYPSGNSNSLMTPLIGRAEVIHYPGELTLSMLNQMGWPVFNLDSFEILGNENEAQILVYPNPLIDHLRVFMPSHLRHKNTNLAIYGSNGKKLMPATTIDTVEKPTFEINLEHWPRGNYLLKIRTGNNVTIKRVSKL